MAVAQGTTPFVHAYAWSNSTGFGSKYANPATLPTGAGRGIAFTNDDAVIAIGHSTAPTLSVYPWSAGFGTKYSDPGTLPTTPSRKLTFN